MDETEGFKACKRNILLLRVQAHHSLLGVTKKDCVEEDESRTFEGREDAIVYVSIDTYVFCGREANAVRFLDTIGFTRDEVSGLVRKIGNWLYTSRSNPAGLDIMKIGMHLADIPRSKDKTVGISSELISSFIDGFVE